MSTPLRIGFLGLGIMGKEMVLRLRERGFPLTVWNLEPERVPLVTGAGAVAAASPKTVAEACDILCLCVLHAAAAENCCFGPEGAAEVPGRGRLVVDFSTVNPDDTRRIAARMAEAGWRWVDAPVSGGPGPPASLAVGAVENRRPQPGSPEHPPMPLARFAWHGVCLRLSRRSRKPCLRTFSVQSRRQAASEPDADDLLSDPGVVT